MSTSHDGVTPDQVRPYLVAYADGELPAKGMAWVEAQLERDPLLRQELNDICLLQQRLRSELPEENDAQLDDLRMHAVLEQAMAVQARKPANPWFTTVWTAAVVAVTVLLGTVFMPSMAEGIPVRSATIQPPTSELAYDYEAAEAAGEATRDPADNAVRYYWSEGLESRTGRIAPSAGFAGQVEDGVAPKEPGTVINGVAFNPLVGGDARQGGHWADNDGGAEFGRRNGGGRLRSEELNNMAQAARGVAAELNVPLADMEENFSQAQFELNGRLQEALPAKPARLTQPATEPAAPPMPQSPPPPPMDRERKLKEVVVEVEAEVEVETPVVTKLDVLVEEIETEDAPVALEQKVREGVKGREEAVAASETGGSGAFMALGAGGGASNGPSPAFVDPQVADFDEYYREEGQANSQQGQQRKKRLLAEVKAGLLAERLKKQSDIGGVRDAQSAMDNERQNEALRESLRWREEKDYAKALAVTEQMLRENPADGRATALRTQLQRERHVYQQQLTADAWDVTEATKSTEATDGKPQWSFTYRLDDRPVEKLERVARVNEEIHSSLMPQQEVLVYPEDWFEQNLNGIDDELNTLGVVSFPGPALAIPTVRPDGSMVLANTHQSLAQISQHLSGSLDGALVQNSFWGFLGLLQQRFDLPFVVGPSSAPTDAKAFKFTQNPGQQSVGRALLAQARMNGYRLRIANGQIDMRGTPRAWEATEHFGLKPDVIRKAFGSAPMVATADDPQVTFAFDADTASYTRTLAAARQGHAADYFSIRPEHFVNSMPQDWPEAVGSDAFTVFAEAGLSPIARGAAAEHTMVVALGVVARPAAADERKPLNLTLAIDTSASMARPGALDRVKLGLRELVHRLQPQDRLSLVAFGDRAQVIVPPTRGDQIDFIWQRLQALQPEGSTNAEEGLALAYRVAQDMASDGSVNRVVFATDGATFGDDAAPMLEYIAQHRGRIALTVLSSGPNSQQVHGLEQLADRGDGEYFHLGSNDGAQRLFTTRLLPGRLGVLARDSKIQVSWNPERVSHARLIGFDERRLQHKEFRDNRVDAGEIAPETRVTALFEIIVHENGVGPLGTAAVRYFDTSLERVRELARPLPMSIAAAQPSARLQLLALAAASAEYLQRGWWDNIRNWNHRILLQKLQSLTPETAAQRQAVQQLSLILQANPTRLPIPEESP